MVDSYNIKKNFQMQHINLNNIWISEYQKYEEFGSKHM